MSGPGIPTGTVTFLFTDIEGSTRRWEAYPQAMQLAFARQEAILRYAVKVNGGHAYKMIGDAFQAAFPTAPQALQAAMDAQHSLCSEKWPAETGDVRVRMAMHTGITEERGDDYVGPALNRVARLLSAGHGGQVLLTLATQQLLRDNLPAGVTLRDMGEYHLRDLIQPERIFQVMAEGLPAGFPPLKTLDNHPNNLPRQATPLVGREKEVEAVVALLRKPDVALVTLTGPGGSGKTRLALQAAAEVLDDFSDGIWFVELAALLEHRLVIPTIAQTLGVKEAAGTPIIDTLNEYLKDKHLLLVLDNFEQVVEAATEVSTLIGACPHLKVLATSRAPLHVRGEKEYAVPPLSTPDLRHLPPVEILTRYEAVQLFIERATDVMADFQVTNDNAPAVAEICVKLDGLPLAIELAAAKVRMLPPQALLARLSSRLKVLTGGSRDLPARQQTLRNTIEWSYDLLEEGYKQLFRRMAVFSGGSTLEALEVVCAPKGSPYYDGQLQVDVLDGVEALVSNSLLQQREGTATTETGKATATETGGEPRFWMLETIHEYAREKLQESGEADALQRQYALYFMTLAEEAEPHLGGAKQGEWLQRLEDEHDNLRAALDWLLRSGDEGGSDQANKQHALRLSGALWRFWHMHGHVSEGRRWLEMALERSGSAAGDSTADASAPRAKVLHGLGGLAWTQGDLDVAQDAFREALALWRAMGDVRGAAFTLNTMGLVAASLGHYAEARSYYEDSLASLRRLGGKGPIAATLNNLGNLVHEQGDYSAAWSLLEESMMLAREVGNTGGVAASATNLGHVSMDLGDYDRARDLFQESLKIFQELGSKQGIIDVYCNLSVVAHQQKDYSSELELLQNALLLVQELGGKIGMAECIEGIGAALGLLGYPEDGTRLLAAGHSLRDAISAPLPPRDRTRYANSMAAVQALISEQAFQQAWSEGSVMSPEEAGEYALRGKPGRPPTLNQ
jgi:predicted ATPase/class 3 adenylate cyclase/Tfp pilus assembly protein PilF